MQSPGSPDSPTACEVCSQLQASYLLQRCLPAFKDTKYSIEFGRESYSTTLGTTAQISGRSPFCSFCALILHTLSLSPPIPESTGHADPSESNEVTLKWEFSSNGFIGFSIEDSSGRYGLLRPVETLQDMLEYDFMPRYSPFVDQRYLCEVVQAGGKFQHTYGTIKHLLGRELLSTGLMNFDQLAAWLSDCEIRHHDCTSVDHGPMRSRRGFTSIPLTLIDVTKNCLVDAKSSARYVTLSYVWGGCEIPQTVVANRHLLAEEGVLSTQKMTLPQTIRDAMLFVQRLGEQYLWVDSLCIVQDSLDKLAQIRQMDQIYSHSLLTIVVCGANNADAGIPGVRIGSREAFQQTASLQGFKWANVLESFVTSIRTSEHIKRGWTYQEQMLSTRCLFIGKHQAYWHCRNAHRSEDVVGDRSANNDYNSLWILRTDSRNHLATYFGLYEEMVETYTGRRLSYGSDILNAFSGILNTIGRFSDETFSAGLPLRSLPRALLWMSVKSSKRRLEPPTQPGTQFPSWSWIGWYGRATYQVTMLWQSRDCYPLKCLMQDIRICSSSAEFWVIRDEPKSALHGGSCCLDRNPKASTLDSPTSDSEANETDLELEQDIHEAPPGVDHFARAQHFAALDLALPQFLKLRAEILPASHFRFGVVIKQAYSNDKLEGGFYFLQMLDENGMQCGALYGHAFDDITRNSSSPILLVGMSYFYHYHPTPYRLKDGFDDLYYNSPTWCGCVLNVLVVKKGEDGISERVAIGQLQAEMWTSQNPEEEDIVLQ